ncbi:MAG: hypothetical protein QM831_29550 [Kofleriaceae bacterium]
MPIKDGERRRAYMRAWYAKTKAERNVREREKRKAWGEARRKRNVEWITQLKASLVCVRCGEDHPACIVFHHRDPNAKEIDVSVAVQLQWSIERIRREIEQCEVLCQNCHMKHHASERRRAEES